MVIDKGLLAEVAGLVLLFVCVAAACTTESGRQGLARIGIGAAALLLRIAEAAAGGAPRSSTPVSDRGQGADKEKPLSPRAGLAARAGAARDVLRK